jgi:hypothetical protein
MGLMEFLSLPGQERTRRRDEFLGGLLNYYLGPTGIPERLVLPDAMNIVSGMGDGMTASQEMLAPDRTAGERIGSAAEMLASVAGAVGPAAAARVAGGPAAQAMSEGLLGIGVPTRQGLDEATRRFLADESGALTLPGRAGGIRAYHGSPHDFDRFSMEKIGTGEGAQAYGHGLYFAEAEGVARGYRDNLLDARIPVVNDRLRELAREMDGISSGYRQWVPGQQERGASLAAEYDDLMDRRRNMRGRMYEVNIAARPEDFIDYDAPLSQQSDLVKSQFGYTPKPTAEEELAAFEVARRESPNNIGNHPVVAEIYRREAAANAAERLFQRQVQGGNIDEAARIGLSEAGIPGIRYLDAGSRGAGDGSRNYVVFDENLIEIVRKYGIAGAATLLGVSQADIAQAMGQQQPQGLLAEGPQ